MEVNASEIEIGSVFYAMDINASYPTFRKYKAISKTEKTVKGTQVSGGWGSSTGLVMRASIYRFFTSFESAREVWVSRKMDADINKAEENLERLKKLKDAMLMKTDI